MKAGWEELVLLLAETIRKKEEARRKGRAVIRTINGESRSGSGDAPPAIPPPAR